MIKEAKKMTRRFIKNNKGKFVKDSKGRRLFWSDKDGDSNPKHSQTVYSEEKSIFGGSKKVKSKYDLSKRKFKK